MLLARSLAPRQAGHFGMIGQKVDPGALVELVQAPAEEGA